MKKLLLQRIRKKAGGQGVLIGRLALPQQELSPKCVDFGFYFKHVGGIQTNFLQL